jgi:phosphatidylserine/phosphatidylglycerophosphate/cardiolipin synthase-like enzyme
MTLLASGHTTAHLRAQERIEIAWTGPGTQSVPLRRVDQVLYELVDNARKTVLLVSYAAYKAKKALESLRRATDRGVTVELVIELSRQSGGKLVFDSAAAIRKSVPEARIFYWPLEERQQNESGKYGSMHAKCLVVDGEAALLSSANLTDYALELNMELGLLIRGGTIPVRMASHFSQLMSMGALQPVPQA